MNRTTMLIERRSSVADQPVLFAAADRTVWDGVYTEEQATRGRADYLKACASCHAADLRGGSTAPSLVEESFAFQ